MPDVDAGEQDLLAATAGQTRRVRPEFVNYAKKAKRVDVRKLKENIWRGLDIKIAELKEPQGENEDDPMVRTYSAWESYRELNWLVKEADDPNATDPSEARVFSSVISGLQKSYPKEKMEEISTSFCFICLLHLANEQGLKLESVPDETLSSVFEEPSVVGEEDVSMAEKKVGNIWDLKVRIYYSIYSLGNVRSADCVSLCRCTEIRMLLLLHNRTTNHPFL
jgi:condensin complex subunit 2